MLELSMLNKFYTHTLLHCILFINMRNLLENKGSVKQIRTFYNSTHLSYRNHAYTTYNFINLYIRVLALDSLIKKNYKL